MSDIDSLTAPASTFEAVYEPLVRLQPSLSAEAALKRIHLALLQRIRDNDGGVRETRGGEYLHDFRVAVRRTRTGLGRVKQVYPQAVTKRFAQDFRWLAKTTGAARDLQVYLRAFDTFGEHLGTETIVELAPFVAYLESERRREDRLCVEALGSSRYAGLVRDWEAFLRLPSPPDEAPVNAAIPVHEAGKACVEAAYRRAVRRGAALHTDSAGDAFHGVRLDFKKLRYLLEFFSSLFAEELWKQAITTLKLTQDALGAINDLRVQAEWLDRAPNDGAEAARRLQSWLRDRQARERQLFLDRFGELLDDDRGALPRLLGVASPTH